MGRALQYSKALVALGAALVLLALPQCPESECTVMWNAGREREVPGASEARLGLGRSGEDEVAVSLECAWFGLLAAPASTGTHLKRKLLGTVMHSPLLQRAELCKISPASVGVSDGIYGRQR